MEEKLTGQIKILLWLTFVSLLLVIGILLWDVVFVHHSPDYLMRPAATSDVEVRLQNVESGLENLQKELKSQLDQKLFYFGGIALLIAGVASFMGIKTFSDLDGLIKKKIHVTLEKQLYQLDITNQKIWIISNEQTEDDMKEVIRRLRLSGLSYFEEIKKLDRHSYSGVTVVPVFNPEMEKEFSDYLERNKLNLREEKSAFILYTKYDMTTL